MTLEEMRQMLFDIVNKFKKYGDRNIYYVEGLKILSYEHAGYLPDNLHPDAGGQFVMAENFIKEVIPFFVK